MEHSLSSTDNSSSQWFILKQVQNPARLTERDKGNLVLTVLRDVQGDIAGKLEIVLREKDIPSRMFWGWVLRMKEYVAEDVRAQIAAVLKMDEKCPAAVVPVSSEVHPSAPAASATETTSIPTSAPIPTSTPTEVAPVVVARPVTKRKRSSSKKPTPDAPVTGEPQAAPAVEVVNMQPKLSHKQLISYIAVDLLINRCGMRKAAARSILKISYKTYHAYKNQYQQTIADKPDVFAEALALLEVTMGEVQFSQWEPYLRGQVATPSPEEEDPEPPENVEFESCNAMPGSMSKIELMRWRIQHELPIHHPDDRTEMDERNAVG